MTISGDQTYPPRVESELEAWFERILAQLRELNTLAEKSLASLYLEDRGDDRFTLASDPASEDAVLEAAGKDVYTLQRDGSRDASMVSKRDSFIVIDRT